MVDSWPWAPWHLVVRSCSDWTRIIGYLITVPLLGELDSELMSEIVQRRPKFTVNPDEGKIGEDICNVSKSPSYAFWYVEDIERSMANLITIMTQRDKIV
jgi:hypothetical protein